MLVVVEGQETLKKMWGKPSPKRTLYRLIRYHVREDQEEGSLLLNTITGELVLLNHDERALIDALPAPYVPMMDGLIDKHFLVPEVFDEMKLVGQFRAVLRKFNAKKETVGFTILPTTTCNARCFYCYESDFPRYTMTSEMADRVVNYIATHCGPYKKVFVNWFGGEPLIGERRIDQICDGLEANGIDYQSSMISNGFLFSQEMAHKAKQKWRLRNVQITLDGTENVYNRTKSYVNVNESPYLRVLDNIDHLLNEGIRVIIRLNLDFHNADDLKVLIDELAKRFDGQKKLSVYVYELFEDMGFDPVSHNDIERQRLIDIKLSLNHYIVESGFEKGPWVSDHQSLPALRPSYCMADNPNALLINPIGQFGKCEHQIFSHLVGDIEHGFHSNPSDLHYWLESGYTKSCEECSLFPYCGRISSCTGKRDCLPEQINDEICTVKSLMRYQCNKTRVQE